MVFQYHIYTIISYKVSVWGSSWISDIEIIDAYHCVRVHVYYIHVHTYCMNSYYKWADIIKLSLCTSYQWISLSGIMYGSNMLCTSLYLYTYGTYTLSSTAPNIHPVMHTDVSTFNITRFSGVSQWASLWIWKLSTIGRYHHIHIHVCYIHAHTSVIHMQQIPCYIQIKFAYSPKNQHQIPQLTRNDVW